VLPGAAILKLGRLSEVYTWIYIANEKVGRVRTGQRVELAADTYPGRVFVGRVVRINEQAEFTPRSIQTREDRTRLVFGVKVVAPNPDRALLPGMPVEAVIVDALPPAAGTPP
jgi:HlyD family secretion protein